jgi:hypothetical protein
MPKTKKPAKVPFAQRRGLEGRFGHDLSFFFLLVRADIDPVTDALAREIKAKKVTKGVPREDLPECDPFSGKTFYPFQYRGHPWTTIVHKLDFYPKVAQQLSKKLHTRALLAGEQDTAGTIEYILFEDGQLAECFHWHDLVHFRQVNPAELALDEHGFPKGGHGYYAGSKFQKLNSPDFEELFTKRGNKFNDHVDHLLDEFLKGQDAYLGHNWMGEPGTEFFPLAEATDEDILRIDVIET